MVSGPRAVMGRSTAPSIGHQHRGLVSYPSSDESDDADVDQHSESRTPPRPTKKARTCDGTASRSPSTARALSSQCDPSNLTLPPLPTAFRDLYSSTVRTSTQDDPELHAGRKRVTPHVVGHWPSHVYLEWLPTAPDDTFLASLVASVAAAQSDSADIHTLLTTSLSVPLPLHVSMSRSLTLTDPQKVPFLTKLRASIEDSGVRNFEVAPVDDHALTWHSNEDKSRWFLVLKVKSRAPSDKSLLGKGERNDLESLLAACNEVARRMDLPVLYSDARRSASSPAIDSPAAQCHVSLAWSLTPPHGHSKGFQEDSDGKDGAARIKGSAALSAPVPVSYVPHDLLQKLRDLHFVVGEVKVRIGQDVSSIELSRRRGPTR